jgi:hypothetical protein
MTDPRPIIFGPGDKLAWLEDVATHPDTTDLDARMAVAITNRINKYTGVATVGQQWIAKYIGRGERSVRDSSHRLERFHLMGIKRSTGRGHANSYRPNRNKEGHRRSPPAMRESQQIATTKAAIRDTKGGGQPPPLPKSHLNSSSGAETGREEIAGIVSWLAVKERLEKQLKPGEIASWIDPLKLIRLTEHEVVLGALNEFVCRRIENNYFGDRLREAWTAEVRSIQRVLIVVDANSTQSSKGHRGINSLGNVRPRTGPGLRTQS